MRAKCRLIPGNRWTRWTSTPLHYSRRIATHTRVEVKLFGVVGVHLVHLPAVSGAQGGDLPACSGRGGARGARRRAGGVS